MQEKKQGQDGKQHKQNEPKLYHNNYDKIFKENMPAILLSLAQKYFNIKIVESKTLEAKLQSTIEREVDFLRIVKTEQGEEFILHIEFQSSNETDMIYRIKEYNAIIQRKYKDKDKKKFLDIHHYVIFLGKGKMTMQTHLPERHIFHQFKALALNELDFNRMLQSQIPEEIVLAILCDFKGTDPEEIIDLIVKKLKKYSEHEADLKKFIDQLEVLSRLRKLDEKNINNMPIKIKLEDDNYYRLGIEKGMERGIEKGREKRRAERKRFIIAMLALGNKPEEISEHLDIPIELVLEIQQELN